MQAILTGVQEHLNGPRTGQGTPRDDGSNNHMQKQENTAHTT